MHTGQNRTIAVNSPGGPARQYRVQARTNRNAAWRQTAVFADQYLAWKCLQKLEKSGLQARVVPFRLPTAA